MADENTTPPKISEISIGGKTYEIVDLQMRRTFMKYYDKLHSPYGSITGVLTNAMGRYDIPSRFIKLNNVYLVYLIGLDANPSSGYWGSYIIARTGGDNHIPISAMPLTLGANCGLNKELDIVIDLDGNSGTAVTFKTQGRPGVFGIIRLNTFNFTIPDPANNPDNWETIGRQDTWPKITTRIGSTTESDLNLK